MSIETTLFNYFTTQWGSRTKVQRPNTNSAQFSGSYTDSETVLGLSILDVGSKTLTIPVNSNSSRQEFYILQCNLVGPKDQGCGAIYGHIDQLKTIFENQSFSEGSYIYNFETSRRREPVPDEGFFVVPWECPFFVFIN